MLAALASHHLKEERKKRKRKKKAVFLVGDRGVKVFAIFFIQQKWKKNIKNIAKPGGH